MGEAKRKQYSRKQFLKEHPWCCYCGAAAITTDHCPPRALFFDRKWPEGYEFPACKPCNSQARSDEQIVSVVAKMWADKEMNAAQSLYWQKQVQGLYNARPDIAAELSVRPPRNEQRKHLRRLYGDVRGDALRRAGYSVAEVGPETEGALDRFGIKLGKALYYKHTGKILDGEIWMLSGGISSGRFTAEGLAAMTRMAPFQSETRRANEELQDQFIYRFNCKADDTPILFAVVQFTDQILYSITAVSNDFLKDPDVVEKLQDMPVNIWPFVRVEARREHWLS